MQGAFSQDNFFYPVPSKSVRGTYTLTHNLSTLNLCIVKKKSSAYSQPACRCSADRPEDTGHLLTLAFSLDGP